MAKSHMFSDWVDRVVMNLCDLRAKPIEYGQSAEHWSNLIII